MIEMKTCPMCGSHRIKKVTRDVKRMWLGKHPYTAPRITLHECPNCGEQFYGPEAMKKMESFRPTSQPVSAKARRKAS